MSTANAAPGSTVSAAFVTGMLSACEQHGLNPATLLHHAEIAIDVLHTPQARIPLPRYAQLYNHVTGLLDDEGFGLFSQPLRSGCFEFLCRSVLHAATLEEALTRAARFLHLVLPDLAVRLESTGGTARLRISEARPLSTGRTFAFEWLLRLLHGLACWLTDRSLTLDRVDFPYPRPAHAADYALIYTADSRFDASSLVAHFDARLLALSVRRDELALKSFLLGAPGRISTLYRRDRETASRVRDCLRSGLPEMLKLEEVAARLYLSPRTLHRRLQQEGSAFQTIKDNLRRELALEWLGKTRHPLSRIAGDLGYGDATAFYRAFVGWQGESPSAYRRRMRDSA